MPMNKALAALLAAGLVAADGAAAAQTAAAVAAGGASSVRVNLGVNGAAARVVTLPTGQSLIVELPVDARDVLVSNPKVADVVLRSPRRLYVLGTGAGRTDAVFFDGMGRQILSLDIRVGQDVGALGEMIGRMSPGSQVKVDALNDSIVLSGMVASAGEADRVMRLASRFVEKPEQVLNMLSIADKEQVMLKVRVVEVQRSVIKQLGIDLNSILNQVGEPQYFLGTAAAWAVNGGALGGLKGGYDLDTTKQPASVVTRPVTITRQVIDPITGVVRTITEEQLKEFDVVARDYGLATVKNTAGDPGLNKANATLQALERVGLVRTLAEPNLTTVSGEPAKFLAGGEFPVPVAVDENGRVTTEYKPYGVGLGFTPVVLSGGRISLRLSTEVSELTSEGAFSVDGLTLAGLKVRRAETTVELPSGGAMMIAGLLQNRSKQAIDSIPGLTTMPYIGALFRSRDFLNEETELVIIVTPYLVQPTSPANLQTPADGLRIAGDLSTILHGRLNAPSRGGAPALPAPPHPAGYGYVIE